MKICVLACLPPFEVIEAAVAAESDIVPTHVTVQIAIHTTPEISGYGMIAIPIPTSAADYVNKLNNAEFWSGFNSQGMPTIVTDDIGWNVLDNVVTGREFLGPTIYYDGTALEIHEPTMVDWADILSDENHFSVSDINSGCYLWGTPENNIAVKRDIVLYLEQDNEYVWRYFKNTRYCCPAFAIAFNYRNDITELNDAIASEINNRTIFINQAKQMHTILRS